MIVEATRDKTASSKTTYINLEQHRYFNGVTDLKRTNGVYFTEAKKAEYRRSLSQGQAKRMFSMSYFSLESFVLLVCLTASLLLLPLILPPLPPPPLMLLLVPICILVVLMMLALTPSKVQDMTYAYA